MRHNTVDLYIGFIAEDLEYVEELHKEILHWQEVYKKRVFELKWAGSVKEILGLIKYDIKRNLEECQYYLTRIEEIKNAKISNRQSKENGRDVEEQREGSANTDKTPAVAEQEDMGIAHKEVDNNRS